MSVFQSNAVAKSFCNPVILSAPIACVVLYYILFCLFLSTCVLQSVCVHTMDFVSGYEQIN